MKEGLIDDNINHEYIIRYLRDNIKKQSGLILELEEYAAKNKIPISQPESIRFIEVILKLSGAESILEIGSAIGYSAIRMSKAVNAEVTTIEISHNMAEMARANFKRAGLENKIKLIEGDACEVLKKLNEKYDVIFVDAAKAKYLEFLEHSMRLLKNGGLLISDNVLYKGMTASDELLKRRKVTIVRRLRNYIKILSEGERFDTTVVPIGDGIALSRLRP